MLLVSLGTLGLGARAGTRGAELFPPPLLLFLAFFFLVEMKISSSAPGLGPARLCPGCRKGSQNPPNPALIPECAEEQPCPTVRGSWGTVLSLGGVTCEWLC